MGVQHDPACLVRAEGLGHARHEGVASLRRRRARRTLLLGSGPLRHRADPPRGARRPRRGRAPRHLPRAAPDPQLVPLPRTSYAARTVQAPHRDVAGEAGGARAGLTLACARVVNGEGGVSGAPAWLSIADGRVIATGTGAAPPGAIDLEDAFIAPGFIDLQVNGTGDVDFATATVDDVVAGVGRVGGAWHHRCAADDLFGAARRVRRHARAAALRCRRRGPTSCSASTSKARFSAARPARTPSPCCGRPISAFLRHVCDAYGDAGASRHACARSRIPGCGPRGALVAARGRRGARALDRRFRRRARGRGRRRATS